MNRRLTTSRATSRLANSKRPAFHFTLNQNTPGRRVTGSEPTPELESAIAFSDRVQKEDMEIVELVQKGLASRSYDRGVLCAKRENGVRHFHELLRTFLP